MTKTALFRILFIMANILVNAEEIPFSYTVLSRYDVWIEGEDALQTNFYPGESRYSWWHEYAPLSGRGILELSVPDFSGAKEYFAVYEFEVPQEGYYKLFGRTRVSEYLASPYYVSMDGGEELRHPRQGGGMGYHCIAQTLNWKLGVFDLGVWQLSAGKHTLKVVVRECCLDNVVDQNTGSRATFVQQGFDSFFLSRVEPAVPQERNEILGAPLTFEYRLAGKKDAYEGVNLEYREKDWSFYRNLSLTLEVGGSSDETFNGRLRLFLNDGTFRDLIVSVPPEEFGKKVEVSFNLDEVLDGVSRTEINGLWLYSFSNWYVKPVDFSLTLHSALLSGLLPNAPVGAKPILDTMPPPGGKSGSGVDQFVWNLPYMDTGESSCRIFPAGREARSVTAGETMVSVDEKVGGVSRIEFDGLPLLLEPASIAAPAQVQWLDGRRLDLAGSWNWKKAAGEGWIGTCDLPDIAFTVQITPEKNREARIEYSLENKRASIPVSGISFDLLRGVKPEAFGGEAAMMVGSRTFPLNELTSRHSLYAPQLLTHNMAAVYGDDKVLYSYLAQEHPLDARADFGRGDDGIFCRLTVYPQVKPAEKYTLGPIMIGAARGDWKAAADRFRTWWKSWADKPLIPEWFQSMGGLVVCQPENIADFTEKTGIRTGHSGSWLPRQTEGWYPLNYLLGDAWAEAWRERIAAAQKQGGKVSLYSNPLMSSRVIPDTEEISMKYAVREKDGFPVYSEHTHRHHPMVLPALSEAYAKIYLRYLSPAIDALKPDVLYMDQIGAVPLHVDYQPENKGNRNFCEWSDGQARFCREVVTALRRNHPDLVFGIEGINVQAMQYVTFALLTDNRTWEVFRYTFPDMYFTVGEYDYVPMRKAVQYAEWALLSGQPMLLYDIPKDADAENLAYLKEIITFKQKHDARLYRAVFRGKVWEDPDLVVTKFVNSDDSPIYVYVARKGCSAVIDGNSMKFEKGIGIK